ncbi:hypothetical protein RJ640_010807 [Escallonia rubra]|uniref:RRM domain-containing protein n=1 Tax=Escallonia rubra TaxID=112253 RepID=A0AA88R2L2_9ASTE|nr:hypothetical protein RJ640_010807 [Escallonia rubra]
MARLRAGERRGTSTEARSRRKVYVGGVPTDMPSQKLVSLFAKFGEIEEKIMTGMTYGYVYFVYKTEEAARAATRRWWWITKDREVLFTLPALEVRCLT